jgi:hypothetical protein
MVEKGPDLEVPYPSARVGEVDQFQCQYHQHHHGQQPVWYYDASAQHAAPQYEQGTPNYYYNESYGQEMGSHPTQSSNSYDNYTITSLDETNHY